MAEKMFLMGNEALGRAAEAAGANAIYGYPITPSSEVLEYWARIAGSEEGKKKGLVFLQAEDEIGAGFMLIGGVLAGARAFTATAGPGNILMQDAFSMAEAMRFPVVAYVCQRGGPSTSTVIYSQSEVNLTCFGGNGNGFRIVYSPATLQELFDYGIKVFNVAWKYRFPTFLLTDGYLAKTMGEVEIYSPSEKGIDMVPTEAYMLERERKTPLKDVFPSPELDVRTVEGTEYACFRNCLNLEEETFTVNREIQEAYDKAAKELVEHEVTGPKKAKTLVVAHGIVAAAAKAATEQANENGGSVKLFRPITLRPFPDEALRDAAKGVKKIIVMESAIDQLSRFVKSALYGNSSAQLIEYFRPSMGILTEEIADLLNKA